MKKITGIIAAAFAVLVLGTAHAEELVANGSFSEGLAGWTLPGEGQWRSLRAEVVAEPGAACHLQLRIDADPATMKPWALNLRQRLAKPVAKGTALTLTFRIRGSGIPQVFCAVEENREPYAKSIKGDVPVSGEWQTVTLSGTALGDYPADGWKVAFNLAYGAGTIDIADVSLSAARAP